MQTETFTDNKVIEDFENFLSNKDFPCVAARAALTKSTIQYFVAEHMACPKDDRAIVEFLYNFVDKKISVILKFAFCLVQQIAI